jgi:2-keto-4-pentenoate hydratase/2-oxohepta-3-ene-1,7-dioic acid hydratase in catechol pathway
MKLVRYGAKGAEKPGLIDKSGQLRDLSAQVRDLDGEAYAPASLAKLAALDTVQTPRRRRQAALRRAGHRHLEIRRDRPELCDHAKETGSPIPTEPIFFIKANTALSGPNDAVEKPRGSTKLDWECEIAAIIGTRAKYVSRSRRAQPRRRLLRLQRRLRAQFPDRTLRPVDQGQVARHLRPVGPWLVTKDEIPDVQKLSMWLDVNGQRRQTGSTSTMIFSMAKCISYVSQFMTLLPGDIVTTGTPPGVGTGMKPPQFLNVGDVVTLGIEGLGEQRQEIIAA